MSLLLPCGLNPPKMFGGNSGWRTSFVSSLPGGVDWACEKRRGFVLCPSSNPLLPGQVAFSGFKAWPACPHQLQKGKGGAEVGKPILTHADWPDCPPHLSTRGLFHPTLTSAHTLNEPGTKAAHGRTCQSILPFERCLSTLGRQNKKGAIPPF